jgi:hypothetical protein
VIAAGRRNSAQTRPTTAIVTATAMVSWNPATAAPASLDRSCGGASAMLPAP